MQHAASQQCLSKTCNTSFLSEKEKIFNTKAMVSGDSRMKKVGGALQGQGKCRGEHKNLSCMVIFHCFENEVAMINPIKPNIGLSISLKRGTGIIKH